MNGFRLLLLGAAAFLVAFAGIASALAAERKVEAVLSGLQKPVAIAIQPGNDNQQYAMFVAESGAKQVVMAASDRPDVNVTAIAELPHGDSLDVAETTLAGMNRFQLLFIDNRRLVVATHRDEGAELRLYDFGGRSLPIMGNQSAEQVSLEKSVDDADARPTHVAALARTRSNNYVPDMLIAACVCRDGATRLWKIPVRAGTLSEPAPFAADDPPQPGGKIGAIAVSPDGYVLVAENHATSAGVLKFFEPVKERVVLQLAIELDGIADIAYSPVSGNLYAASIAPHADARGGIFRLDAMEDPRASKVRAVRIADVDRPTSLTFGPDGALYVTALGDAEAIEPQGALIRILGAL